MKIIDTITIEMDLGGGYGDGFVKRWWIEEGPTRESYDVHVITIENPDFPGEKPAGKENQELRVTLSRAELTELRDALSKLLERPVRDIADDGSIIVDEPAGDDPPPGEKQ